MRHKLAQHLEYRWWKSYLGKQEEEEYKQWKLDYWERFIQHLPEGLLQEKNQEIADLGCGPAGIFMVLSDQKVSAIDPLIKQYSDLPNFKPESYPWVDFQAQGIEDFKGQFDGIFCLNAINHVADLDKALESVSNALKPGARLVLSSDVHKRRWTRNIFKACSWIDPLHPQQDDRQDYESQFARLGLKAEDTFAYGGNFLFEYRVWVLRKPKEE
jgi:2-polyprenyl-6-hydroxyphenyl methylase/3-demethylubiquinone-9 3-methyltransferase